MEQRRLAITLIITCLAWGPGCGTQRVTQTGNMAVQLRNYTCLACHATESHIDDTYGPNKNSYGADASWIATHKVTPTINGQLSDVEINELIDYIKSLKKK